jgi:hypothetical protein
VLDFGVRSSRNGNRALLAKIERWQTLTPQSVTWTKILGERVGLRVDLWSTRVPGTKYLIVVADVRFAVKAVGTADGHVIGALQPRKVKGQLRPEGLQAPQLDQSSLGAAVFAAAGARTEARLPKTESQSSAVWTSTDRITRSRQRSRSVLTQVDISLSTIRQRTRSIITTCLETRRTISWWAIIFQ